LVEAIEDTQSMTQTRQNYKPAKIHRFVRVVKQTWFVSSNGKNNHDPKNLKHRGTEDTELPWLYVRYDVRSVVFLKITTLTSLISSCERAARVYEPESLYLPALATLSQYKTDRLSSLCVLCSSVFQISKLQRVVDLGLRRGHYGVRDSILVDFGVCLYGNYFVGIG
jgi:hypothetical protein